MKGNKKIKHFISYYKPHKKLVFIDLACAFLVAGIDLAYPMFARQILIKYLPTNKEMLQTFFIFIGAFILMYVVRSGLQYVVDYWGHILGVRIEYDMRKVLFKHLQKLPFKYYDKTRTGHIMSRMINDLNEISELAHHGPEDLFLSLVMLIGAFIAMLVIQWKLALAVYFFIPILIWFAIRQRTKMARSFKEVKKKIAGVNATLESSISGVRVAKSFVNEYYEIDKFDQGNTLFKLSKNNAYKNMATFVCGVFFITKLLNVVVLGVGGFLIYKKEMDFADLIGFTLYVNAFLMPIRRLTNFVQQYESGMAGFERFTEILDIEVEIKDQENAVVLSKVEGNITFEGVSFSYNNHEKILDHINLEIKSGHTLALVGPSGGGKTTMCHLIPRFYEVDEGSIRIDGIDIKDIQLASLRTAVGLVSQDIFLFAGTIGENILYGRVNGTEAEMIQAAKYAEIHSYIIGLEEGYNTLVGERGIRLSGGQKQRISIARVFLKNPPILILDEATSALDNTTEIKVQEALERLAKGRTTLVIAHRLSTIKHADEIVVITETGIQEKGTHASLLEADGLYTKLYKAQFRGYIPDKI